MLSNIKYLVTNHTYYVQFIQDNNKYSQIKDNICTRIILMFNSNAYFLYNSSHKHDKHT